MLGDVESREVFAQESQDLPQSPNALPGAARAYVRAHSTALTVLALAGLFLSSVLLRSVIGAHVHGPFVFMDELGYEQMARSFAHTGHFALLGQRGLAYSPLYPIVLSPIYALTASTQTAYEWAKFENAVLISLSVFPVYAIARSVLPRGRSLAVAGLSLLAPLMLYSGFEMSESLAYPLCLLAFWTMVRAILRPSVARDALLLAAIALATAARLQLVVLVPAALTAILLVGLVRPAPALGRVRGLWQAVSAHRLLFGFCGTALVVALARAAMNGGNLPLAGRYSNVGTAHASAGRVVALFFQHLAGLDFAVGVIPFLAALLGGWALVRFGFPRHGLVFASVAAAATFWVVLEVAYDAAAFDATKNLPHARPGFVDLPRIHERYLIYLVPLFLVALLAVFDLRRPTFPRVRHVVTCAAVAAMLPALIPFGTVINGTNPAESFSLLVFGRSESGTTVAVTHATTLAVALSTILALVYVLSASRLLPPATSVVLTAFVFLGLSTLELGRQVTPLSRTTTGLPARANWVDRVAGTGSRVSIVSGPGVPMAAVRETTYWNASVARAYYTCRMTLGTDWNEQRLAGSSAIRTRYAVVPASFAGTTGRILARDPDGHLVLVAPPHGTLAIPAHLRCGS
jgi:hypothetical protein